VLAVDREPDADVPGEHYIADIATREGNRAAVAEAVERFGGLDAVVANAGFQHVSPVEDFDEDRWDGLWHRWCSTTAGRLAEADSVG
jgi:3-hydroxybutyrate dehydrogenase